MAYLEYNSKKIHYLAYGKGDLLIILPGNTSSSTAHRQDIQFFSNNYLAASIDYMGTGKSERLNKWNTDWWKESAEQVAHLIKHLNNEKAILVGTSGGAIIGLHLALQFPEKVKALVADSFCSYFTNEMLESNVIKSRNDASEIQTQFWKYCHGEDWREVIDSDTELIKSLVKEGGEWLNTNLNKISCPVLLTGSKSDDFLPDIEKDYQVISSQINNSEIFLYDRGSHPLMWSAPEVFRTRVLDFLKSI